MKKTLSVGLVLAALSATMPPAYAGTSEVLREVYFGNFQSYDDLIKGAPDQLGGSYLLPGQGILVEVFVDTCTTNMIVTAGDNRILVPDVAVCGQELRITDDDVILDY
jgi:hypothetical protein